MSEPKGGIRGDAGWRRHRPPIASVSRSTESKGRSLTHVERDAMGHNASRLRHSDWRYSRSTRWSWYKQRRRDLEVVFRSRHCVEGAPIARAGEMDAIALAMAFHLQAHEGAGQLRSSLEAWFEEILPSHLRLQDEEPDLDEVAKEVSSRRRDITAIRAGILLRVTWDERCRLGLRTIRPSDLTATEFRTALKQRKQAQDRQRSERNRRRKGQDFRNDYRWQGDQEPWLFLGVSRATWYRSKKAGTLRKLVADCTIAVPGWLSAFCAKHDLGSTSKPKASPTSRETSASQLDVVSSSANALVSPSRKTPAHGKGAGKCSRPLPASSILPPIFEFLEDESDGDWWGPASAKEHTTQYALKPLRTSANYHYRRAA